MKRIVISSLFVACMILTFSAQAGGGSAGASPGSGFKIIFGNGGTDFSIPIRFEAEGYLGDNDQHGVGGQVGFDIGTGTGSLNYGAIMPEYKYYFNGGKESGPFVGAYFDLRFRSNFNIIGIGGQGGYQHYFNDKVSIYGAGSFGFANFGFKAGPFKSRASGGELGLRAGVKYTFGNN